MRSYVILTLLLSAALAGCAESTPEAEPDDVTSLDEELQVTDDTGIIRGVVVDSAIVPVAGVTITIQNQGLTAETNEAGEFGFEGLEPGTYFLEASRLGFLTVQQSTEVQAGVERPPIVRILMERDVSFNPYSATQVFQGFYQCGTSVLVVCGAPNILLESQITSDVSTPYIFVDADPTYVQTEMVWQSTQPVSPALSFEMEALDGCDDSSINYLAGARGESPIRASVNETVLELGTIGGAECGIYHSVFAGDALNAAHCVSGVPCLPVGFSLEQEFEWFITTFHGYTPPEEWWFLNDGALPPPS